MELTIVEAARKFKVSQQALLFAIRRGALPVVTVPKLHLRLKHKDVAAWLATVPEWRQKAGRKGAAKKWANYRAAKAARSPAAQAG